MESRPEELFYTLGYFKLTLDTGGDQSRAPSRTACGTRIYRPHGEKHRLGAERGPDVGALGCGGCREGGGLIAADALPASTAKVASSSQSSLPPMITGRREPRPSPSPLSRAALQGQVGRDGAGWALGSFPAQLLPPLPTVSFLAYNSRTQRWLPEA